MARSKTGRTLDTENGSTTSKQVLNQSWRENPPHATPAATAKTNVLSGEVRATPPVVAEPAPVAIPKRIPIARPTTRMTQAQRTIFNTHHSVSELLLVVYMGLGTTHATAKPGGMVAPHTFFTKSMEVKEEYVCRERSLDTRQTCAQVALLTWTAQHHAEFHAQLTGAAEILGGTNSMTLQRCVALCEQALFIHCM